MCAVDFTVRQFLAPLAHRLMREGYRVAVSCGRGPHFEELRASGLDMRDNPVSRSMNLASHAASIWRTWRLLRRERFDVLHVHTPIAALLGRAAARLAGTPVRIYTAHGFYFHEGTSPRMRRVHVMLEKFGALCGTRILTVSDEDRRTAIDLGIAAPEAVETILNGVDTSHFDPARFSAGDRASIRAGWGIPPDAPVAGLVGRLVREKGIFEFFQAAAQVAREHPDARFLVVGGVLPSDYDADTGAMHARIAELGLTDRIVFTGLLPDPAPALAAMDVFCLPSYREGMPVSLLEAMAMECACVATDIRGCREEIEDGRSGRLVPVRDPATLAETISGLFRDPGAARALGTAARARVLEHFDIRRVLDHQVDIYERLTRSLRDDHRA